MLFLILYLFAFTCIARKYPKKIHVIPQHGLLFDALSGKVHWKYKPLREDTNEGSFNEAQFCLKDEIDWIIERLHG